KSQIPQHHRRSQNSPHWVCHVPSRQRGRRPVHRLEHRRPFRMNISAGRHAQSALQRGCKIGDDVTEHIVGPDHVEAPRITDHLHAERIDVHVLGLELRILCTHFFEYSLPKPAYVGHRIRFVTHQNSTTRAAIPLLALGRVFKSKPDHALHTLIGIDVFLNCNLVSSSVLENSARIDVNTFDVLTDHYEVHILRLNSLQRAQGRIQQANWTHVRIEVHLEAHAEQNLFCVN